MRGNLSVVSMVVIKVILAEFFKEESAADTNPEMFTE